MNNQGENTNNPLGTILCIVFFFFFVFSFTNQSAKQPERFNQSELVSQLNANPVNAIITAASELPPVQKTCLSVFYNTTLNVFVESNKLFSDQSSPNRLILVLQKNILTIKPKLISRIHYHSFYIDSEESPILS
jgi:hypothetical protein